MGLTGAVLNEDRARGPASAPRRIRTLLVDEDPVSRDVMAGALAASGEVVLAASLDAAPQCEPFDVVVVGCLASHEPAQYARAVEFVRAVGRSSPAVPVIIAAGRGDAARVKGDLLLTGLREVVEAPLVAEDIVQALHHVVRARPRRRGPRRHTIAAFRDILARLEESAATPSLAELARLAGMSPWHLSRTFHAVVGMSLRHYARDLRLKRAHGLFVSGGLTLTEVAARAGFYDVPHFVRTFRGRLGISPREYRRRAVRAREIERPTPGR